MKPVPFEYYAPNSSAEALERLHELGYNGKVLAGGQSLIPAMNFRMARPGALVDLNRIPELSFIRVSPAGGANIGTMTRVAAVEKNRQVTHLFPLLAEVIPNIAHQQIRNRGTFGGAIAHADPAGQLPAIALALNADLKIARRGSERWVNAEAFFMGPFSTVIEPDEMLSEVALPPLPARTGSSYVQVSRQRGGYSMAAVASLVSVDEAGRCTQVRMTLISVSDVPLMSQAAGNLLVGQKLTREAALEVAEKAAKNECDPATDVHATADYRRHLVRVLVEQSLTTAYARAR
jgi:carbon-monoxide dehydrogenase medium subunit